MTDDALAATVIYIIATQAMIADSAVAMEATPEALGLDSLRLVEVVFAIEEAFDISVPFNANAGGTRDFDISTVGSVIAAVRALVAAKVP